MSNNELPRIYCGICSLSVRLKWKDTRVTSGHLHDDPGTIRRSFPQVLEEFRTQRALPAQLLRCMPCASFWGCAWHLAGNRENGGQSGESTSLSRWETVPPIFPALSPGNSLFCLLILFHFVDTSCLTEEGPAPTASNQLNSPRGPNLPSTTEWAWRGSSTPTWRCHNLPNLDNSSRDAEGEGATHLC